MNNMHKSIGANKKLKGFSLIELMVVVAIVGMLAAIAYPSFTEEVKKSRRADAQGALLGLANAMERHYTETGAYTGAGTVGGNTGAPTIFSTKSPVDGTVKYYDLTIKAVTGTTYELWAEKSGAQESDICGDLTLTNSGLRGIDSPDTGVTVADCWK